MSCAAALEALALPGAIQSWKSGTDECYVFMCMWSDCLTVISPSPLLIYLSVVSLSQSLSRFAAFFYPCDSRCLLLGVFFFPFPALVFSSSFWEFSHPSLNLPLVLVFSSPSALVLFSIPLQRSVDCDDGGGRESAHWFFWQGNVKVCKPVCKCQRECVTLSG